VRLATTDVGDGAGMHYGVRLGRRILRLAIVGPVVSGRLAQGCINGRAANAQITGERMGMRGQLLDVYRNGR
jgi:hypothetical protein